MGYIELNLHVTPSPPTACPPSPPGGGRLGGVRRCAPPPGPRPHSWYYYPYGPLTLQTPCRLTQGHSPRPEGCWLGGPSRGWDLCEGKLFEVPRCAYGGNYHHLCLSQLLLPGDQQKLPPNPTKHQKERGCFLSEAIK